MIIIISIQFSAELNECVIGYEYDLLDSVTQVAAGYFHSLALLTDGSARAWGINSNGQLGDGTTSQRTTPVQVSVLAGVKQISAGYYHSLALLTDET